MASRPLDPVFLPGPASACEPYGEQADEHYLADGAPAAGEAGQADGKVDSWVGAEGKWEQ